MYTCDGCNYSYIYTHTSSAEGSIAKHDTLEVAQTGAADAAAHAPAAPVGGRAYGWPQSRRLHAIF